MRRKIEATLEEWKSRSGRKPLVVNGARQVGKTYSILKFGRERFDNTVHIDFSAQANVKALFDGDIRPSELLPLLRVAAGQPIDPESTLLFFDEVQACPRALTSLKYFCEQAPEYCIIAAGSLLGVALGREDYSYPVGKVDQVRMHPLDFEEYLWALDEGALSRAIATSFEQCAPFPLHDQAMDRYRDYLLVGGMPEVVANHIEEAGWPRMREVQRSILDAYLADMTKYASPLDSAKILNVWRAVPEQLAKENHKFQFSTIASSARAHQYEAPINWLAAAGLVTFCYRVSEGVRPLGAFAEHDFFKLYLIDCGLLAATMGLGPSDVLPALDKGSRMRGGLTENYVMQQLVANGAEPFYWGTSSKAEVDFIVQSPEGAPIPIEVKSGSNVTARSLASYRKKYEPPFVARVSGRNFGNEGGIRSVPLYAAWCLGAMAARLGGRG